MELRQVMERYLALAGELGRPVALAAFGLSREETERVFSVFDEDYHISRFFHFTRTEGEAFSINGFPQTHLTIDAQIRGIL